MRRAFPGVTLIVTVACAAFGQPASPPPAFEVASVRVSQTGRAGGEGSRREQIQVSPDTVTMRNVSLRSAIRWAYHVMDYQVTGPDWLAFERFDIVAKAPGAATEDELRLMLQPLLGDRFKVALHRQTKEMATYVLTVGKNGPKLQESKTEGESSVQPDRDRMSIAVQRTSISQLVDGLTNILHAPVLDETGLKGRYDVKIDASKYLPDMGERGRGGAAGAVAASLDPVEIIMRGLQEELGLKLDSRKSPVDLVVVDHAEKVPTEN